MRHLRHPSAWNLCGHGRWRTWVPLLVVALASCLATVHGQREMERQTTPAQRRAQAFVHGRTMPQNAVKAAAAQSVRARTADPTATENISPAEALSRAHTAHAALLAQQRLQPQAASLTSSWTAVGPARVQTSLYGLVTGRVTAVAIDPGDTSGNTVYLGTSGGGVWKSTNAAGAASAVSFVPLTDTLAAFAANTGTSAIPSLSIGAVSVQPGGTGVILAGTGDPNDASDSYYGQGLLRSTDNGQTWSLVQSTSGSFLGQGFAAFAWSSTTPGTVVAAVSSSAEAAVVGADKYPGTRGVYFSQDAGATWRLASIFDGSNIVQWQYTSFVSYRGNAATSVVWNPVRHRFYAAVRSHGYYESADGITWTRLANQPAAGLTTANCPTRTGDYGLTSCPIFRGALAVQPTSGDLFALTVDLTNKDQGLWQDTCNLSGANCSSGTVRWGTQLNATPMESSGGVIAAGDYNLTLAAIPAATALSQSDTLLFAGTTDLFRCGLSGGCSLRNTTNTANGCSAPAGVSPAQHAIAWQVNPSNSSTPRLFLGNDGGLWRSLDGVRQQAPVCSADDATHFDNLNSGLGSLAEVVDFSSHPTDANTVLVALGANGSAAATTGAQASGTAAWTQLNGAESGTVAIDQANGQTWLLQAGAGVQLHTCTKGTACTAADFAGPAAIGSAQVMSDSSLVDAPALLDPALNTNVIAATCRVYRGPTGGGSAWSSSNAISSILAGPSGPSCNSSDASIRSLAAGGPAVITNGTQNSGSSVLYAGLAGTADGGSSFGGALYVNTAANTATSGTAWTNAGASAVSNDTRGFNPAGFDISSIAVDPSDSTGRTVYATVMGFGYPHLYRSTIAGASWTNISANLPDAPANSVAVDPTNPLIVYVALDTGVYATQDVTTCVSAATGATGNCWGVLGTALPNAPVLSLVASKTVSGGVLRAGTFGRGIWQTPLLSAGQASAPVITFAPAQILFAAQNVGSTSDAQTVTVTNTGNAVLNIASVSASAGFAETDTCANTSLTVGANCTLTVTFSPSAAGASSGTVTVYSNVTGGYAALPVSGTGRGLSKLQLSPSSLVFGTTAVGATSTSQTITVSNAGTAAASLQPSSSSADFPVTASTCATILAAGSSCTLSVAFAPSQNGAEIGTASIADENATYTAQLRGTGVGTPAVSISPSRYDYGNTAVNGQPGYAQFTVSNTGNVTAYLSAPVSTNDFSVVGVDHGFCDNALAAGATCVVAVGFQPSAVGQRTGTLTVSDSVGGDHVVALVGTGVASAITFTPSALAFGTTAVGSTSAAQHVTVANNGSDAVQWGTIGVSGDFGVASNTCTGQLFPGQSCGFDITFAPTLDGTRYGAVTLPDQYTTHSMQVQGNGRGTAVVAVAPGSLQFGNVVVGGTSVAQSVTLTNSGTAAATVSTPTITGDFFVSSTTCAAALQPLGGTCALSVAFAPTATGARTGTLTITDSTGTHTVALSGTGAGQPLVSLSPASLTFERTALGGTSTSQSVTVSNAGSSNATLNAAVITGDFALTANACGSTLPAGAACSLTLVFKPTAAGTRTGVLSLADSGNNHTVQLSGTGVGQPAVTISPASLTFAATAVFATSSAQAVTVNNTGTADATLSGATIAGDFLIASNACGGTLGAGSSCTLQIEFAPQAAGSRAGTLTVTDAVGPHTIPLSGTAQGQSVVSIAPSSIAFAATPVGSTAAGRTVFVVNGGTSAAALGAPTIAGDFSITTNSCGATLAAGDNCAITITFTPTAAGTRNGVLTVQDSTGNHATALTGTGTTGVLVVSPAALAFPDTALGSTSGRLAVTLTNSGAASLRVISATASGDFSIASTCAGTILQVNGTCGVTLTFAPSATGARSGSLTITTDSASGATTTVPLSGDGTGAFTVVLTPTMVDFGTQLVGTASAVRNITVSNTGNMSGALGRISVSGDFTLAANTCGTTLPPQTGCTVSIAFTPGTSGTRGGLLTVVDDAGTQTASLTGTGTLPATDALAPRALLFAPQIIGVAGATQTVTLTNSGDVALTLVSAAILTGDFTAVNGCGPTLPAHTSCNITVAFVPRSVGSLSGTLQVTDVRQRQTVALSGTGVAPPGVSLLPSSLTFARTGVGVVGAAQPLTLTNNGGSQVTLSAITVVGDFGILSGAGSTCAIGVTLPLGGSCALQIAFLPTGAGPRTGTVTILSSAPTQTTQLSGTGVDFQLLPNGDTTVTTTTGNNAVFPLLLRPLVTTSDPVTYTCTGAPANTKCTVMSQYGDLSAVQTVTVTLLTGTTAKRIALTSLWPLLGLLPLCARRKRLPPLARVAAVILALGVLSAGLNGCGSARKIADSGTGTDTGSGTVVTTPSGSYNITVSATAAGVTHTVPLTLVVK